MPTSKIKNETVESAVVYAKNNGKLVICAAGSGGANNEIWPAKSSNTIAVTGVKYKDADSKGLTLEVSSGGAFTNYRGSYVDFSVYLQKGNKNALGLDQIFLSPTEATGSSAGAAFMSGVAALIWAKNPNFSADKVLSLMKESASSYRYSRRQTSQFGWGVVDANYALILAQYGVITANISGPSTALSGQSSTWPPVQPTAADTQAMPGIGTVHTLGLAVLIAGIFHLLSMVGEIP